MKKLIFIQLLIAVLLSSCLVGKRYHRPNMNVPGNYINNDSTAVVTDSLSAIVSSDTLSEFAAKDTTLNLQWFELFGDSILNSLITQALDSNTNLRIAALRIQQSRSVYKNAGSYLWPSIGYSGSANIADPADDNFQLLGTAAWELDFWGKIRHSRRAAYAQMLASEEGLRSVKTTLVSDVASLYFLIRDLDNRVEVAKQTVASRTEFYNMVNERFLKGESAELDKLQAEQQLALGQANLNSLQREQSITERSMNILLGQTPRAVPRGLKNTDQPDIPEIPAGLPSTLLENRPDVKAAEQQLIAETEKIGVTQAMRFPSFSLTGLFGLASNDITTLLDGEALTAGVTGMIMGPLFEFGRNKRRVDIQKAEAEIAMNSFMDTYRRALADVENALVGIKLYRDEYAARMRQVEAARKALMLTKAKYEQGFSNYLEVLIAESYAFDAEMLASFTRGQQLATTVSLYRALGGGW
jgi:outer membrane protein, multidrug efflux system